MREVEVREEGTVVWRNGVNIYETEEFHELHGVDQRPHILNPHVESKTCGHC